jgi:bifunctional ADP-heptose synthase (sugar kinase/adenylyltransferase)
MLSFFECVDHITIFPETTGAEVIRLLRPDAYLCVEGSWQGDIGAKEEVVAMLEHGGEIYYTARQDPNLSTSAIIEKIGKLEMPRLLERFQEYVKINS